MTEPREDASAAFAAHVAGTRFADLPPDAVAATKTFLLDTLGVAVAGSTGPYAGEVAATLAGMPEARIPGRRDRLPAQGAALMTAYQIHNAEFDCIHEAAVVHPMTAVTGAALAHLDRVGRIPGRAFLTAVALGVDIACHVGVSCRGGLRFFRPGTAGAFGAAAAVAKLMELDAQATRNALSIAFSQTGGTMQAHTEGSALLGLQVGFAARNGLVAADLAAAGIDAPKGVFEGPFGYFALIESPHDLGPALAALGRTWRITEVAHKPFPSGRATHGVVDAALALQARVGFDAGEVEAAVLRVPSLTNHLVGRPVTDAMALNYARLCARFVVACTWLRRGLAIEDFAEAARADATRLALAHRIEVEVDDNPDPNALAPVEVEVRLTGGRQERERVEIVYGNPARPMTREAQLAKLTGNWALAAAPLPEAQCQKLVETIDGLEDVADARVLLDLTTP